MNHGPTMICLTGGPCAGKTSFEAYIKEELMKAGILAFFIPESATLLIQAGAHPALYESIEFQKQIIGMQKQHEDFFLSLADTTLSHLRKVIFCDRGLLDGVAYLPGEVSLINFQDQVLLHPVSGIGLGVEQIRSRYAGIIHLVTAANGAEEFYTLSNNSARSETVDHARMLDERTKQCWLGHSHISVIPNTVQGKPISFDQKMRLARDKVFALLGIPVPIEIEDKFLLDGFDPAEIPVPYQKVQIEQTYLDPAVAHIEERVRMRTWEGFSSYYYTSKEPDLRTGGRLEIERIINHKEYLQLLKRFDPTRIPIVKDRYCFLYADQYFEVDVMQGIHAGRVYLEREKTDKNESTVVPDFIRVKQDVTGDPNHSMAFLARK
ncbi:MAG: AAA family ATPase [Candidatus Pacebacteria bacterium]|nr:AAA family ATPase [Candidatus Paceibacterota bacterium]